MFNNRSPEVTMPVISTVPSWVTLILYQSSELFVPIAPVLVCPLLMSVAVCHVEPCASNPIEVTSTIVNSNNNFFINITV